MPKPNLDPAIRSPFDRLQVLLIDECMAVDALQLAVLGFYFLSD